MNYPGLVKEGRGKERKRKRTERKDRWTKEEERMNKPIHFSKFHAELSHTFV